MPLGVISSDDFNAELSALQKLPIKAKVVNINKGRGNIPEKTTEERMAIVSDTLAGMTTKDVSEKHNISESSVSAYKNGATSTATYNKPDGDLKKQVETVKIEISNSARNRLLAALETITPTKLDELNARHAAGIAKDMSVVIRNMEPQGVVDNSNRVQVVVMAPKLKDESDYDVITVNE